MSQSTVPSLLHGPAEAFGIAVEGDVAREPAAGIGHEETLLPAIQRSQLLVESAFRGEVEGVVAHTDSFLCAQRGGLLA
jgi:hypothetical protein